MAVPLFIRGARQLLTLRDAIEPRSGSSLAHLGLIDDGCLLIEGPLISEIGTSRRLANLSKTRTARQIDVAGSIILPGFIDPNIDLLASSTALSATLRKAKRLVEHGTTFIRIPKPSQKAIASLASIRPALLDIVHTDPLAEIPILSPFLHYATRQALPLPNCPIALSSSFDGARHPACSMQTAISIAHLQFGLSLEDAIHAATINAAFSIGIARQAGTLEPGKQADFILLDVPDYRAIPYHLGENLVRAVFKNGAIVYRRGDLSWHNPS